MNDQHRIETAADNCEVLRARLARYEDGDGNPITTIAEQAREIERLQLTCNDIDDQNDRIYAELADLKAQQGEAVEVVGWRRLDRPYELTAYPSVCAMWHGVGYPVQALYTHPADQVARGVAELKALLPALDDALEDLELHGRHSDQGCRKLKDWYRKAELITDRIDGAHCVAGQSAEPGAELVRQCIAQELATWEGDFKGPVHTAMRCLQVRIDAKMDTLK